MWSISNVSVPEEVHRGFSVPLLFITKVCLTLFDPMDFSTPGCPVLLYWSEIEIYLLKFMSIESVMSPPSPPALSLSQHRGLFQ